MRIQPENLKRALGATVAVLAILLAIFALTPGEWQAKLQSWTAIFSLMRVSPLAAFSLVLALVALGALVTTRARSRQELRLWRTRADWWNAELPDVIARADEITFIDMYQGAKPVFWDTLINRLKERRPFALTLLDLKRGDPALDQSLAMNYVKQDVIATDIARMKNLMALAAQNDKRVSFGYWDGLSQGPLVIWKVGEKEYAAAGFWQQVQNNTDITPWVVTERGYLFASLRQHRERVLQAATARNEVYSSEAGIAD
jgi:hypothetical protein